MTPSAPSAPPWPPGLPLGLFAAVARELERSLGVRTTLGSDASRSAPEPGGHDPFRAREADLGFLCAPGYLWLAAAVPPSVELVPAAFVFDDPRNRGRPVYFADVVLAPGSRARTLADLRGARWVYNDPCSLSGYFSVLAAVRELGEGAEFFGSARAVGSHHAALAAVARAEADCAAIDSNTLLLERRAGRDPGLRVLRSLGPFPVQPVVARAGLSPASKAAITAALRGMHRSAPGRAALSAFGVIRCAPIAAAEYEPERALLCAGPEMVGARAAGA